MSREERRAYKRMMKNYDPYAPPVSSAQKARIDRVQARRAARQTTGEFQLFTGRFLLWTLVGAAVAGLLAFSLVWPTTPLAFFTGLAGAAVWVAAAIGFRFLQRRLTGAT